MSRNEKGGAGRCIKSLFTNNTADTINRSREQNFSKNVYSPF